jgi:hypothetical protein
MKKYLFIIIVLISSAAKAQYTPMSAFGYQMKYLKVDSGFALPMRDTSVGRGTTRPGLMIINTQDTLPYYFNGQRWKPVYVDSSGVIQLINTKVDSVTVNGNTLFYWIGGLGYGATLNKLDSIHVSNDSIFTCIAGNCTFQYTTSVGSGTVTSIMAGFGLTGDTITASGTLAVDTTIFHTSAYNNVTFAAISHTHSASDIISGTLPIVRGGTGLSGIGYPGQYLRVTASGTSLEYFYPTLGDADSLGGHPASYYATVTNLALKKDNTDSSNSISGYTTLYQNGLKASISYVDSLNNANGVNDLSNHIISGGMVTYSGSGYTYYVSACTYVIGGVLYNSRDTSITLSAADATNPRIDLFAVDTLSEALKITGTAATTPIAPQVDPASQLALTTGITLPPGSTTPSGTTSTLIYDENTEWTTGGTATVDFNNTAQPYHGTKDAYVSSYSKGSTLTFSTTTQTVDNSKILRVFIRLNNSNYSFQFQFFNGTTAVSNIITASVNNSLFGSYQNVSIPLSSFTWSGTSYTKLVISMTGKGAAGTYYFDYVSLEGGTPVITPVDYSNKVDSVSHIAGSYYYWVKGVKHLISLATDSSAYHTLTINPDTSQVTLNRPDGTSSIIPLPFVKKSDTSTTVISHEGAGLWTIYASNSDTIHAKNIHGINGITVTTDTDSSLIISTTGSGGKVYAGGHLANTNDSTLNADTLSTNLRNEIAAKFNISDTTNKWLQNAYIRNDSLFKLKNNIETFVGRIDTSLWAKSGTAIYNKNGNVLIGTMTDDGHQLRVNGSVELNIGSDAAGDIFYRDSLGTFTRLAAPVGFTKPVLGFSGYPKWQQDSSGGAGVTYVAQIVTSGSTVTVADSTTHLIINPSATLSSLTVTLPAVPTNGKLVDISFGGTITTANAAVVTSFLVVANTGQGLIGTGTYGQVVTEDHIAYRYNSSLSKWFRN